MAFNSDITELLYKDIRNNADLEIKVLWDPNRISWKHMFSGKHCFNEFLKDPPVQPDFAPVTFLKSLIHLMGGFDENVHRSISMTDFQFCDETQKRCILKTVTSTLKRDTCRCLCWVARAKFDWFISSYWCIVLVRFVHLVRPCPTTTEQSC